MKTAVLVIFLLNGFRVKAMSSQAKSGENLFVSHGCVSCHDIGHNSGMGPSLLGVTQRRSIVWLKHWIKNPDEMVNDPIIKQLEQTYHIFMPKSDLTDQQINDVIAYLKEVKRMPTKKSSTPSRMMGHGMMMNHGMMGGHHSHNQMMGN